MTELPPTYPPKVLLRLPESIRLRLAIFTLWKSRKADAIKTSTLALCLAILSGLLGFTLAHPLGLQKLMPVTGQPGLAAAKPYGTLFNPADSVFPSARQWGELQAEVLRLRRIFARVADMAEFNHGEIAFALELADSRFLDSLTQLEDSPALGGRRFTLAKRAVDHMTEQADLMLSLSQRRKHDRKFTLSGSPVVRAHISSRFGYRTDPSSGRQRFHRGLDFAGKNGSKVLALADGVVTFSGKNGGYGNLVELEHAGGFRTRYAHNTANLVKVGSKVKKGQVIATMGSTGHSTGTHVHLEVRTGGRPVDPLQFVGTGS